MIYLDFETRGVVDLIRVGSTRYAMDEATQALCMCWAFDDDETVNLWHRGHPWIEKSARPDELIARIRDGEPVEAHNAGFEFVIWNETLRREFPEFDVALKMEQMYCSAAKASCFSLPRALGDAVKAMGLKHQKLADGRRLINKLSKPRKVKYRTIDPEMIALGYSKKEATVTEVKLEWCEEEAEHRANWDYCEKDVRAERGLSKALPEMSEREREYWLMDFRMNTRGIQLDRLAAEAGLLLAEREADRLNSELFKITNGAVEKGSQRIPLRKWINETMSEVIGEPTPGLPDMQADTLSFALYGVPTKAGDEAREAARPKIEARWENYGPGAQPVKRAMEICMEVNRSSVAKYKSMLKSVAPDGRLHDIMLYNGADRTGRWSGKGVQPHNFVRGYSKNMTEAWDDILDLDPKWITFMWGEPLVHLAKACRGALTASPGKELYAADFNAIEARKLAWLSNNKSMLTLFQTGGDPYITMAQEIYERPLNKKDNPNERNVGKKAVLGLGYAMGWEKFQETVWKEEGIWLDDDFCKMVVKKYRTKVCPEVPALWKATNEAAIAAVEQGGEHFCGGDELGNGAVSYFVEGRFLHCRLPSGRLLAYLDPEVHTKINWTFSATNSKGKETTVRFPSRVGVAQYKARYHAEQLAHRQNKRLTDDPPDSFLSPHLSFMGRDTYTRQWKRCGTHGGTLVENYDQASSRDLLAEAMYRIDQTDPFELLLSIHDEAVAEAPIGTATLKEFEAIMSEVPKWAPGMPITAEGWIGPRLRK